MDYTFIALIIAGVFFIYIGLIHRATEDEYSSWVEIGASIFTVIGAGEYAFAIALIVGYGFIAPTFLLGLAISFLLIRYYTKTILSECESSKVYTLVDGYKNFTTPDFLYSKFGRVSSIISTAITVTAFVAILWLQFAVGGLIISEISDASYTSSVILIAVIVALYVSIGGLKALLNTDIWQGLLMWIALITVLVYIFVFSEGGALLEGFETLSKKSATSLQEIFIDPTLFTVLIATIAAAFSGPDIWQRIGFSKNSEEANKSLKWSAIAMLVFIIPMGFLAIDVVSVVGFTSEDPFIDYLKSIDSNWPEAILMITALGFLSAWLSTADTSGLLISSSLQNEFLRGKSIKQGLSKWTNRGIIVVVAIIGVILAIERKDFIANDFSGVISLLSAQGLPVFLILNGFGNKVTVPIALIGGALIAVMITYVFPDYNQGYFVLLPMLPGLLCLIGGRNHK